MFKIGSLGIFAGGILGAVLFAGNAVADKIYVLDEAHTEVRFAWSHSGVSIQTGEFTKTNGTLNLDLDNVENSSIDVTIDATSVSSGVEVFDGHLNSASWLHTSKYPTITFKSTKIERTGEETANVTGDLTLHGVTKSVTLDTKLTHMGRHPVGDFLSYYQGDWIAFSATTEILHQAFRVGSYSTGPIKISIVSEMKHKPE